MSDHRLTRRLLAVSERQRHLERLRFSTAAWLTAAMAFLVWKFLPVPPASLWLLALIIPVIAGTALYRSRRRASDIPSAAVALEQRYPELDSRLLTSLTLEPAGPNGRYTYLQSSVLADTIEHARRHPWLELIPTGRVVRWQFAKFGAFVALIAAAIWASRSGTGSPGVEGIGAPALVTVADGDVLVEPGDVEVELGRSLIVTARFAGTPPTSAELVTIDAAGNEQRLPLSRSLDDPLFGARIAEVQSDLTYHVESPDTNSREFKVTTFEYPELVRADAVIMNPAYSGRGEQRIEDTRRVSLYEGSTLRLECRFNKPLKSAILRPDEGDVLTFGPFAPLAETEEDQDDVAASVTWRPTRSQNLELIVADEAGRALRDPVTFLIKVLPNQPPELTVTFPSRDVQISPLEELAMEATAWDDFGVQEYGIVVRSPDGDEKTIALGTGTSGPNGSEATLAHLLALEELQPEARDLLSYSFYADDLDSQGESRRTFSDVFFAEVRHFDEEYREQPGQQQSGGGGGQAGGQQNPAQQLVDLQRQIVIAEWNSIRAWSSSRVADQPAKYRDDIKVIADSQTEAGTQLDELKGELDDPAAQQHAARAGEFMKAADEQLAAAQPGPSIDPLVPARNASQSAYQELLRLRDRLHIVQRGSPGGGGGGGGSSRMDRQLEQLELRNDRNRYEQERQAQSSEQGPQAEQVQVLNRLRELAQRQEDLNERIKELDDRRRLAKTDAERQEIERELKRLREEQQELLRDADELNERMSQPENQRQMADAREQLEQTRSDLQSASEALEQGQASRALSSGTRAQQQLEEMKEEFRRRSAGAFDESVRELQQDARELADRQRAIGNELHTPEQPSTDGRPTLRDTDQRADLGDALSQQQEKLSALQERMREIVEQSEQSEPLLSEKLYDTILDSRRDQPEESLRMAEELLRRGFTAEGTAAEEQARRGIEKLEAGIHRAAESILGDELKTLQRAQDEVADLRRALENELAQAQQNGNGSSNDEPQTAGQGQDGERPAATAETPDSEGNSQGVEGQPGEAGERGDERGRPGSQGSQSDSEDNSPSGQRGDRGDSNSSNEQGQQPGQQGEQPGEQGQASGQQGDQSEEQGQQPGQSGQQGAQGQSGQQGAQGQGGQQQGQGGQQSGQTGQPSGQQGSQSQQGRQGGGDGGSRSTDQDATGPVTGGSLTDLFDAGGGPETAGGSGGESFPLTGQEFSGWSERLRDVEDMLSRPELRSQAGAIRERARDVRRDFKRHAKAPDWDLVRTEIYGPLLELQTRLAEEIARRRPQNDLVPIDRDPVPEQYSDLVREYYEQLSRARLHKDAPATP